MSENELSPIALFVYNRPDHTRATIEALLDNPEAIHSTLYIFSDGAKNLESQKSVEETRSYIQSVSGFKKISISYSEENRGLAKSIIHGVSFVVNAHGKVIVLEDDLVSSKYFLQYMNEALRKYEDVDKVISIHGYNYPVKQQLPETFFLRGASCWGWATWTRGWAQFNPDGAALLENIIKSNLSYKLDYDGSHPYLHLLRAQVSGKVNSWAIRWHASAILADKLTLYPSRSLIQNIGLDGSGTHCGTTSSYETNLAQHPITLEDIPIMESKLGIAAYKKYYRSQKVSLLRRVARAPFRIFKKYILGNQ